MSWLAGKSEFQSSLGISNSSLSRDTLAISTEQIQSEPHRLWASGKWKGGEWIICSENAEVGGSTSSRLLLDRSHKAQPMRGNWATRGGLFYKQKARAAYRNRLSINVKKNKL